ncbi:hypothetical protein CHU32_17280 [Superficieibacter electus]|uniref:Uncharacterized protein n=1 Tax=Superficieibacter electus TaxID=2022662 RepID=A0A2P5GLR1_9ENTR|nr:hypothetical protein [Superficieibacter electus]POP42980.1 hypothetical protein CHU33_17180 [Superficieibacter electus]POP46475.1 hypothetical protein CHU32_17280 [Superficieibacter electus]
MRLKKGIYIFWGIMDVLALAIYVVLAIHMGRIPFYTDIVHFQDSAIHYSDGGGLIIWMLALFAAGFLLRLSLFYSAWSFIGKKEINTLFFILQEAGRVITFTGSLPLLTLLAYDAGIVSVAVTLSLFIVSEILKIGSIIWCKTRPF